MKWSALRVGPLRFHRESKLRLRIDWRWFCFWL